MVTIRDLANALRDLEIDHAAPVIAHTSLSAFGEVRGDAETMLGALMLTSESILMPAFTYKTMLIPEAGPDDNGLVYGSGHDTNKMAEFFRPDMPADKLMGVVAETMRKRPNCKRSNHPIFSFSAINMDAALAMQTIDEPLGPIRYLAENDGWVLLLGADHTANTAIHYAERLAGRKQFIRWALTPQGVRQCPHCPGCSNGFDEAEIHLISIIRRIPVGEGQIQGIPVKPMLDLLVDAIRRNPHTLLCQNPDCEPCNLVRRLNEEGKSAQP